MNGTLNLYSELYGGAAFAACEHCYPQFGPQKLRTSLRGVDACLLPSWA